jgi:hypothetical protein
MSSLAPIALFVFNRPSHTEQTLAYLQQNPESRESDLVIFSDGPRSAADEYNVEKTRAVVASVSGFRSVRIVQRSSNWGLASSIIAGVTEVLESSEKIIVLEDDLITSPQFLGYMNLALERYSNEDRVGSIHAYMYPIEGLPEFFFMKGGDCWGWGTWRDRWKLFEQDGRHLLRLLRQKGVLSEFDRTGGDYMVRLLIDQIRGANSSWFIRWHASLFLRGKLTLQPGRSLIHNIGVDNSGTHCEETQRFDVVLRPFFKGLPALDITENPAAVEQIHLFFKRNRNGYWYKRFMRRVLDEILVRKILQYG